MQLIDPKSSFMTGYLKGAEAKVLSADHLSRMLRASSIKDMIAIMRDTEIGQYLEERIPANFDEADERLWGYLGRCFEALEKLRQLPRGMGQILAVYRVKFDVANVKSVLHALAAGRKARLIPIGTLHAKGAVPALSRADGVDAVAEVLAGCGLTDFASILHAYRSAEDARARLLVEAELDKQYYRDLFQLGRAQGGDSPLARAVGVLLDLANLQMIFRAIIGEVGQRASDFAVDGGPVFSLEATRELTRLKISELYGRLQNTPYHAVGEQIAEAYARSRSAVVVEQIVERHRFSLLREMLALRLFSSVLVLWYAVLKEAEVRNVRLLLKAMLDGQPPDRIKESLATLW